jgi:thiol-disulfide isomerase/thioredoxin
MAARSQRGVRSGAGLPASLAGAAVLLCGTILVPPARSEEPLRLPRTYALLVNGGGSPARNYLSHLHHLQDMAAALRRRGIDADKIHVFSADGDDPKPDLSARSAEPADFWLIEGTAAGTILGQAEITNTVWEGVTLHPARLAELRSWFVGMRDELAPGDTLLVFVTDHGSKNAEDRDNGFITLWNESLSVLEFRALLAHLPPFVRVVSVMSQCFSGAFADAMSPLSSSLPTGDVCGFYSTTRDREAFGCYPEGRDRDRLGHAFRFIDAMNRHNSLDEAHRAVLVDDTSPDVPVRTSDLFLEKVLEDEASRRKVPLDELADEEIEAAWKSRAVWEPEIRLLDAMAGMYGTFSPRSLAELAPRIESLSSLSSELETYGNGWKQALDDLRRANLERFLGANPSFKDRLDERKIATLGAEQRKSTLAELLPALRSFTSARPDVSKRLQDLRETEADARTARYRVDVRLAAILRMRLVLLRVAGKELLTSESRREGKPDTASVRPADRRSALAALEECESARVGTSEPGSLTPEEPLEPLPPIEEDLRAVRQAMPSWLGIRFRPVTEEQQKRFGVERGAALVEQVYPGSPAGAAGLKPGDLVLGTPGRRFAEPREIKEWTMTSPRDVPVTLTVLRDGATRDVPVTLVPMPTKLPALPPPPAKGDDAPALGSLRFVRSGPEEARALLARRHVLFFWATWCGPCKSSVPELLEWSRSAGVPVLAITDEDENVVRKFLEGWPRPFPERVAADPARASWLGYGVNGTPTFVLVGDDGKIEWRKVGYNAKDGLGAPAARRSP